MAAKAPPLEIRHAERAGHSVGWASLGSGTPVLWLTPYLLPLRGQEALRTTREAIERVAETHRVILVDDRYYLHGQSEADQPVPEHFLDGLVSDIVAVFEAASVARCDVVASFWGTMPAVALAARHPQRVASLLLWDGFLRRAATPDPKVQELMSLTLDEDTDVATRSFIAALGIVGDSQVAEEQRELILALRNQPVPDRVIVRALSGSDVSADAPAVRCRTLVVAPERAILPERSLTEAQAATIPGARLVRIRSAAIGVELEDHDVSLPLVLKWIAEGSSRVVQAHDTRLNVLTPREIEVCEQIALGRTNLEIAEVLSISRWTVQRHVSNAIRKTDAGNRAELAALVTESRAT